MKIIISHDVDHLCPSDHVFRDLFFPKLWLRSLISFAKGEISFKTYFNRLASIFGARLNRIPEIIEFDKKHNIPSVFFFGMDNILGMSYKKKSSANWIKFVLEKGFDSGVHGVEFENIEKIRNEFLDFKAISKLDTFGIRTHYLRYDKGTYIKMALTGYLYDTSEYNKKENGFKLPYKIGNMWEFPLYIMDGYYMDGDLQSAKKHSIEVLENARSAGLEYFTFLFHDYFYNKETYPEHKDYYEWFINYCRETYLDFVSYREAIYELETNQESSNELQNNFI